jgi:hypothetical protein
VAVDERRCAHPTCGGEAHATMTYDYDTRTAWLDDLAEIASPAGYDLCTPTPGRSPSPRAGPAATGAPRRAR